MANTTENENLCGLNRKDFQTTINGKKTDLYILRNRKGYEVAISNYGGAICAIMVPDKDGKVANVIQGHGSIKQLTSGAEPYLSTLIGRWGNRICKGQFTLNGKEYQLALNDGPNHLHGGAQGFNCKVWDARQMGPRSLALHRVSSYGEEGFTGELDVTVEFTFTDDNELVLEYLATTNKKTVVNLTHHAFFSLAGTADPTPTIEDQLCEINADFYLPTDETAIPTGEILKVAGTPFDFRTPKAFGKDIDADHEQIKFGKGFDHNYVLNKVEEGEPVLQPRSKIPRVEERWSATRQSLACNSTQPTMPVVIRVLMAQHSLVALLYVWRHNTSQIHLTVPISQVWF